MNFGIDALRHLFSAAVILQHMASASRYSTETNLRLASTVDAVDGAVIGFFLISGFLFKRRGRLLGQLRQQATRLLVPFLLFSTLYAIALAALGKQPLVDGLRETVTLRGAAMQLYFLPFLWGVGSLHALVERRLDRRRGAALTLLAVLCFGFALALPTASSTGPDYRLLPFDYGAFLIGAILGHLQVDDARRSARAAIGAGVLAAVIGMLDERFCDLALVVLLFQAMRWTAPSLPTFRLPGSGGVYLFHAPIVNYAVSSLLVRLAVVQGANIIVSVIVTYALCLGLTAALIRLFPRQRWLLLE